MYQQFFKIITIFILLSTTIFANSKFYVGSAIALESEHNSVESGLSSILNAGYNIQRKRLLNVSIETEITYSLYPTKYYNGFIHTDSKYLTLALYSAFKYKLNKNFFIKPRVGLLYKSTTQQKKDYNNVKSTKSKNSINFSCGGLIGYKITPTIDISLAYNLLNKLDLTHFALGITYNF